MRLSLCRSCFCASSRICSSRLCRSSSLIFRGAPRLANAASRRAAISAARSARLSKMSAPGPRAASPRSGAREPRILFAGGAKAAAARLEAVLSLLLELEDEPFFFFFLPPNAFLAFFAAFLAFFFSFFAFFSSFFACFCAFLFNFARTRGFAIMFSRATCSCRRIWNSGSSRNLRNMSSVVFVELFRNTEPGVLSLSFLTSSMSLSFGASIGVFMSLVSSFWMLRALCSYIQSNLSTVGLSTKPAAARNFCKAADSFSPPAPSPCFAAIAAPWLTD
mmetsp:Transcript_125894/g.352496  ORF Transcript_125894/g.352496 Transcript_125894/m.352496 type:complete len:277 (-) Transcript_125894:111-941(-)